MDSLIDGAHQEQSLVSDLRELCKKVDRANPATAEVKALVTFLDKHPEFWRVIGDLAELAILAMVQDMNAPRSMKESMKVGMSRMSADLSRPGDGELERLIIRQIVGCWLRLSYIEYVYGRNVVSGSMTSGQSDIWERRLSAAQRRYLRATESLARIRRMSLPAIQVNVAKQQVNQVNR